MKTLKTVFAYLVNCLAIRDVKHWFWEKRRKQTLEKPLFTAEEQMISPGILKIP